MSVSYSPVPSGSGPKRPAPLPPIAAASPTKPLPPVPTDQPEELPPAPVQKPVIAPKPCVPPPSAPMSPSWDDPPPIKPRNFTSQSSYSSTNGYRPNGYVDDQSMAIEYAPDDSHAPLTKGDDTASYDGSDDYDDLPKHRRPMHIKVARKLLLIFNFLIMLAGFGLFCSVALHEIGITPPIPVWLPPHTSRAFPGIIMVIGSLIVIFGFIGWVAALKGLQCCVGMFMMILSMSFVFVVGGSIIALGARTQFFNSIDINRSLEFGYGLDSRPVLTWSWDIIQEMGQCCGTRGNGSDAWSLYGFMDPTTHLKDVACPNPKSDDKPQTSRVRLPLSCCRYKHGARSNETYINCPECIFGNLNDKEGLRGRFSLGCADRVDILFEENHTVIVVCVVFAVIALAIGIGLTVLLCQDSRRLARRYQQVDS